MPDLSKGAILAKIVSEYLNTYNSSLIDNFIKEMGEQHRTLQQKFTKLCLFWLYYLVHTERFDGRNEASVKIAKQIDEAIDLKTHMNLPMI